MAKIFTRAEVAAHNTVEDLFLIIGDEVYDVTEFQHDHPGGNKILKVMAGKDATKPFNKNHNPRILKTWQYRDLCVGRLAEDATLGTGKAPGRFSRMLSWKKGEKKVTEVEINVKEVRIEEEKPMETMVEDVEQPQKEMQFLEVLGKERGGGLDEKKGQIGIAKSKAEGRSVIDVLTNDIALVAL